MVQDESIREVHLLQKWQDKLVIGNFATEMSVAAQNDRNLILLAKTQNLGIVAVGGIKPSFWFKRRIIDFQQCVTLLSCQYDRFKEEIGRTITRMTDDVDVGVADSSYHSLRIILNATSRPTESMNAGYADVQTMLVVPLIKVKRTLSVQDVEFSTQQKIHAIHFAGHDMKITKIDGVTSTGNVRTMLSDTEVLKPLVRSCLGHLHDGIVGMTRSQRVSMQIEFQSFGKL